MVRPHQRPVQLHRHRPVGAGPRVPVVQVPVEPLRAGRLGPPAGLGQRRLDRFDVGLARQEIEIGGDAAAKARVHGLHQVGSLERHDRSVERRRQAWPRRSRGER